MKIYLTLYEKSFKRGTLKPKIEKRSALPLVYCRCLDICREKIAKELSFCHKLKPSDPNIFAT